MRPGSANGISRRLTGKVKARLRSPIKPSPCCGAHRASQPRDPPWRAQAAARGAELSRAELCPGQRPRSFPHARRAALSRMALSDILYPGNPARREEVVRLYQQLIDCIELNFDATNELIGALNTHLQCKLQPIKMNMNGTIRENCDVFLTAIKSIQESLQAIDERLKRELEPDLYQKLHNFEETDTTKMKILHDWAGVANWVTGIALGFLIKVVLSKVTTRALSEMMKIMVKVCTFRFSGIIIGTILGAGIDLIVSAILGDREKRQLETEIRDLKPLVDEFKPASQEYYKTIIKISCKLP